MKKQYSFFISLFLLLFLSLSTQKIFAQASACPDVNAGPDQNICSGQCVNLNATIQGSVGTGSYTTGPVAYNPYPYNVGTQVLVNIDDTWTPIIPMPFCFEFFGTTYNQMVIGSNGILSFNTALAGGFCQWQITGAVPNTSSYDACIMAPYQDIDPSIGSTSDVRYQVYGSAPCREFVVTWYHVPMYSSSCNALLSTSEVVLHETTNIIDIYIENKPLCTSWNAGAAIEGIVSPGNTTAVVTAGRNYPTQWTAVNDGQRFVPSGAPNYTLQWTGPSGSLGNTNTINVCPTTTTTYTATVTNTSCSGPIVVSDQVTINITNSLSATSSTTAASCSSSNGTASVTPSGGSGTYTYSWAPSGGTGSTASNLASGTYTCTITDANTGCTTTVSVTVPNSGNLSATSVNTAVSCAGGNNGSATVTPAGGSGSYTYSWAPSGGTNATASGLATGTYTCTITDVGTGCTNTQVVNITQPIAVTSTQSQTDILCNGSNTGVANVTAFGGTPGYTYNWSPSGGNAASATGLISGTYTCTITDANGCTNTASFSITEPTALNTTISVIDAGCAVNGSATANPTGGTAPYTYSWSSGGTAQTETNLPAGTYTVTITDLNGCTLSQTCVVNNNGSVAATSISTNITCFGAGNGSATVTPNGGTSPYTYSWSPSGGTSATATGLTSGSYTCTITDANGCTTTQSVQITEPTQLVSSTASTSNVSCFGGNNGSGTVSANGGTPAYTYSWAPAGGTSASSTALTSGNYTITITDANGCTSTQSISITQPSALAVNTSGSTVCSNTISNVSATASGGTGPYTYNWSNGATTSSQQISINSTTTYTVSITDANGCTTSGSATATVSANPVATITSNAVNGYFQISGASSDLCFTGSNGVAGWAWLFNGTDTSTVQNPCITLTTANIGQYCAQLAVVNSGGCLDTASVCIEVTNSSYSIPNVFTPNGDGSNDFFVITNTGMKSLHCEIYNRWGELVYEWDSTTGSWDGKTKNGGWATDGVYYYTAHLVDYTDKSYDESGFVHLIKGQQ